VVAGVHRDGGGGVPGLHEGEVVAAHIGETLGVLVHQRGLGDGVGAGEVAGEEQVGAIGGGRAHAGRGRGVVRPVGLDRGVLHREEQHLDGVREADVVGGGVGGVVGLGRGCLDLLDQYVARGTGHALALVVGHNGVVGPHLHIGEVHVGAGEIGGDRGATGGVHGGAATGGCQHLPGVQQVVQAAEAEVQAHVVVGKGGGGQRHTAVAGVEEGEGQVEGLGGKYQAGVDQVAGGTDHVGVADLLGAGCGEGGPEIEQEVIEARGDEVVEGDAGLTHQVVGHVGCPREEDLRVVYRCDSIKSNGLLDGASGGRGCDLGEGEAQPGVEQVVARSGDADRPFLPESGCSRCPAKNDGYLREPRGFARLSHKVGGGVGATVHILLELVVCGQINETRCQVACAN